MPCLLVTNKNLHDNQLIHSIANKIIIKHWLYYPLSKVMPIINLTLFIQELIHYTLFIC